MNEFISGFVKSVAVSLAIGCSAVSLSYAAPPPVSFGELPLIFDADISPDGKHIATVVNVKGVYYAASRKTKDNNAKMEVVSLGEDLRPRYIKWVNNERYVVAVEKSEVSRNTPYTVTQLFTKSLGKKDGRLVVRAPFFRQFNDRVVDWLEDDPDHILMAYSNTEFDPYPDIFKVRVDNGREKQVKRSIKGIEYWYTDDTGTPRIGRGQTESGINQMRIHNIDTGDWESFEKYPGLQPNTPIYGFLKNGSEMIIGDYKGRDTIGLYIYDMRARKITRKLFHNDEYDASGVVVSSDGETVIGAKYVADEEETELLGEYGTLLTRLRNQFKDYAVSFVDQTDDGQTLIVRMSAPFDPGGMYIYNVGDKGPTLLRRRYSNLKSDEMGDVFPVKYTSRDGVKIPAYITLPPTIQSQEKLKDLPFIVLPHGGPYGRDEKRFDYFAQFFATRGYGVMQMNFRGSEGYGRAFQEAGRDNWLVMQEDVEDATRYLLKKGYSDPDRTCIAGWSYGGYAALMGAAKDNEELYDCVIAMAALTDINKAKSDLAKYRGGRHAAKEFFGDAMQDRDVRKANSPVNVADQIKVPVFLAHGDRDENVQFVQYQRMKSALKKAGVKTTAIAFEEEDHFLSRQENREKFFKEIDKFLTKVNGTSEHMTK